MHEAEGTKKFTPQGEPDLENKFIGEHMTNRKLATTEIPEVPLGKVLIATNPPKSKKTVILTRLLRTLGAAVVALVAAWLVGPDAAEIVPKTYLPVVVGVLVPLLTTLDKYLRYGSAPGEDQGA